MHILGVLKSLLRIWNLPLTSADVCVADRLEADLA